MLILLVPYWPCVAEVRASLSILSKRAMVLSRKLRRRFTVSILAEKPSILDRRARTESDIGKSRPMSASVEAFIPVPSWVCRSAKRPCILEITPNPACSGNIDLLTIILRYSSGRREQRVEQFLDDGYDARIGGIGVLQFEQAPHLLVDIDAVVAFHLIDNRVQRQLAIIPLGERGVDGGALEAHDLADN